MARNVTLYDAYGHPVRTQDLSREIAAPTLTGIRNVWSDAVASGLTPQKLGRILRDAAQGDADSYLVLAEEMEEREAHYSGVLGVRKRAVKKLPIVIEAASDASRDQEIADAVRNLTKRAGFKGLLEDLLDALAKGYSVVEILWDRTGAQWIPGSYEWRDPRFFQFDRVAGRELRLRDEADAINGVALAPYKFITHLPKLKTGLPIRGGLARLVAWSFMAKGYTFKDWLAFSEVFGMPLRVGKYGPSATDADISVLKTAVANLGSDAAAVLPDSMMIEFVEAAKAAGGENLFLKLAEWIDRQVSKAVLGQTMTTDDGSSMAQAKIHDEVRLDIVEADAEQLGETLTLQLVKPFIDLNFGPQQAYPQLQLFVRPPEDVQALAVVLEKLVPLGLEVEQSVVRDRIGFPDPEEGAKLLGAPKQEPAQPPQQDQQTPAEPPQEQQQKEQQKAKAREQRTCPHCGVAHNAEGERDAVDTLVDERLSDWEPVIAPVLDPIFKAAEQVDGFQELMDRIYADFGTVDLSETQRALAISMLLARAMGDATDEV